MLAARSPSAASQAQDYKLGGPPDERRYTCPSYELERAAPPPDPESAEDALDWARMPVATAEVAMVANRPIADVREELSRVAHFEPIGGDGYWSLAD